MRMITKIIFIIPTILLLVACGNKQKVESEPTTNSKNIRQASAIGFRNISDSRVGLYWINGSGQSRIICVTADSAVAVPTDGVVYKSGRVGDALCRIDNSNTYVVYNSSATQNTAGYTIEGLTPNTKYAIQIFEYDTKSGKPIYNTNTSKNNPRTIITALSAPQQVKTSNIVKGGFQVNWQKDASALHYEIDLATNEQFTKFVDIYKSADIGDAGVYEFADLKRGTYYYRLRAIAKTANSSYSVVQKVLIK